MKTIRYFVALAMVLAFQAQVFANGGGFAAPIPLPDGGGTALLLGLGFAGMVAYRKRSR